MSAAMTPERQAHLEQVIATARCAGELDGIRNQLTHSGELVADEDAVMRRLRDGEGSRS